MRIVAFLACLMLSTSLAYAKDDLALYNISDALRTKEGKTQLDPGVKLYFADQPYPNAEKSLGTWVTNKKFPLLNKTPKSVCEYTFIDALKELQRRALKEGGNAVVGIESYYKKWCARV